MIGIFNELLAFCLVWTVVLGAGGYEDMTELHTTLFEGYNSVVPPQVDKQTPVLVKLSTRVAAIIDLDTKKQMLRFRGHMKFMWTDTRLRWDPKDYGEILTTNALQMDIWRPDVVFSSIEGDNFMGSPETQVVIFHNGSVLWEPSFTAAVACEVNIAKYPADESLCPVVIAPWANFNSTLQMVLIQPFILLQETVTNGQFDVGEGDAYKKTFAYEEFFFEMVTFEIKLSRKPTHVMLSILFPVLLSGLLGPLAFLIPPDDAEKVSVSVTVLLATAVFMGIINDNLPDRSDKTPTVAAYVTCLILLAFLGVVGNTVVLVVHRKDSDETGSSDPQIHNGYRKDSDVYPSINSQAEHTLRHDKGHEAVKIEKKFNTENAREVEAVRTGRSYRPRTRAERLNMMFFLANTTSVISITLVVMLYIFT